MRGRSSSRRRSLVTLAAVVGLAAVTYVTHPYLVAVASAASREDLLPSTISYTTPLLAVTFSATGAVIHRRAPNLVGWLLHGVGLCFVVADLGTVFYVLDGVGGLELGPTARVLVAWCGFAWVPALILMTVFLPLAFPSGRPPGRRWWLVGAVGVAALVMWLVAVGIDALTRPADEILYGGSWIVLLALMIAGVAGAVWSVVFRYRRAGDVERRQLRWVSFAFAVVCLVVGISLTPPAQEVFSSAAAQALLVGLMGLIPASIGIAITRYRLYEIDRIISRTTSYVLLTGVLVAVYSIVVIGLQQVLAPLTGRSELAVAGATLAVSVVFGPARARLQSAVDRRFNRARYDAQHTVDAVRLRLRKEVALDHVGAVLVAAVRTTVHPVAVSLWLSDATGARATASHRPPEDAAAVP